MAEWVPTSEGSHTIQASFNQGNRGPTGRQTARCDGASHRVHSHSTSMTHLYAGTEISHAQTCWTQTNEVFQCGLATALAAAGCDLGQLLVRTGGRNKASRIHPRRLWFVVRRGLRRGGPQTDMVVNVFRITERKRKGCYFPGHAAVPGLMLSSDVTVRFCSSREVGRKLEQSRPMTSVCKGGTARTPIRLPRRPAHFETQASRLNLRRILSPRLS